MPLSRRYTPEHPPAEQCSYGMDFSMIIPPGVGIASGTIALWRNTVPPVIATPDWPTIGPVQVWGRVLYAQLIGGVDGVDYQLRWNAVDTDGNHWPRTGLVLCAQTS